MTTRRMLLASGSTLGLLLGVQALRGGGARAGTIEAFDVTKTDAEWHKLLTPAQYSILREHGTEPPFSSPLDHETRPGRYDCAGCANPLFSASTKYDSGTGWPSFWQPLDKAVATSADNSFSDAAHRGSLRPLRRPSRPRLRRRARSRPACATA